MIPPILIALLAALLLLIGAFDVMAQVTDARAGPFDVKLLATYGWIIGISILGGVASFYQKVKKGQARWINLGELFGELATSALAGVLTYWVCRYAGLSEWLTAAFIGIGGHMGSRALFLLEKMLERWFERVSGQASAPSQHEPARGTPGDER